MSVFAGIACDGHGEHGEAHGACTSPGKVGRAESLNESFDTTEMEKGHRKSLEGLCTSPLLF